MTDSKIGFKGHFPPKSHLWILQALEIQASMRSIVIPVDKLLERRKIQVQIIPNKQFTQSFFGIFIKTPKSVVQIKKKMFVLCFHPMAVMKQKYAKFT